MKRQTKLEVSLFSFQDIITSVTGIMILVTLLMALDMSQQAERSPSAITREMIEMSQAQLELLTSELAENQAILDKNVNDVVAQMQIDVPSIQRQRDAMARNDIAMKDRLSEVEAARNDAIHSIERMKEGPVNPETLAKELEDLNRRIKEAEEKETLALDGVLILDVPTNSQTKKPWIVEVDQEIIRVAAREKPDQIQTFESFGDFRNWMNTQIPESNYYYLLFKPAGFVQFEDVVKYCKSPPSGVPLTFGIDLLTEKQKSVFRQLQEAKK